MLETLFELSPAEARVVGLLASGVPATEIGASAGIGYNTVRTLLSRAMLKTRTTTQANLVRLVLSAESPLCSAQASFPAGGRCASRRRNHRISA